MSVGVPHHSKKILFSFSVLFLSGLLFVMQSANVTVYANLITNTGCESNTSNWGSYQGTLSRATGIARTGSASCLVTYSNSGGYYTIDDSNATVTNPTQGAVYTAVAWVRSTTAVGKPINIVLRFRGDSTVFINGPTITLTNAWQQITATTTVPANKTQLEYYIVQEDATNGNSFYVDDMYLDVGTLTPTVTPISTPTLTPTPTLVPTSSIPGDIVNLNFYLSNSHPWIQTVCGDMRIESGINNLVPLGQYAINTNASCATPGIAYSGDSSYTFGSGQASSTNQVVGGLSYPEVYEPAQKSGIFSSYANVTQKAQSNGIVIQNLPCTLSSCILPANLSQGVYLANGDVSLNSFTFPANNDYVILVNGNLTMNGTIGTGNNATVLYSVSGNIIVPQTVGVAPTLTTPNLQGIFSTDRSFIVNSSNSCTTELRLNIEGSIIVNAARQGGSLQNRRDLCGANLNSPTMQFTQRLDYILNIPEFLRIQRVTSNEVAP